MLDRVSLRPQRQPDDSPSALADLPAAELVCLFKAGKASPVEAAEEALERIEAYDDAINAFVFQDHDTTRSMARASEQRYRTGQVLSPIDGVPTSIKDLAPVAGWPMRRGSLALDPETPMEADSPPVARLREAGAVFIGKTATPESGSRIVTRSSVHGVTANPYDLSKTPGGSSGGAAAALSMGMGTLALGTDGAGSIRIPSAYCNLFGLKPGFGRVPSFPPSIFMPHSVVGPMARHAADVSAMAAVMSGREPRDPYAWPVPFDADDTSGDVSGLRVALSPTLGTSTVPDAEILRALDRAADALAVMGVTLATASPDWPVDPFEPFKVFWEATYAGFLDTYPASLSEKMDPLLHEIAERGRAIDTLTYHRALADRVAIAAASKSFFCQYDAVLAPVTKTSPFDLHREAPVGEQPDDWRWCPYTYIHNMTGEPAVSVPAGFTSDGLPIGLQLAGPAGSEEQLLRLASALETSTDYESRRPELLREALNAH